MKIFKNYSEEDFEYFKNGVVSGRLNPVRMGKLLWVFPLLSLLFVFVVSFAVFDESTRRLYSGWISIFYIQWGSIIVFGIICIFFLFKRVSLKFQRTQMIILILSSCQLAYDMALFAFIKTKIDFATFPFTPVMNLYTLSVFLIFCFSILRAVNLLKKGAFRKNGWGLLGRQYNEKTSSFSNVAIFALVGSVIGLIAMSLFGALGQDVLIIVVMLFVSISIFSVGITEFIFVLYCKIRFPSFNISMRDQKQIDKEDAEIDDLIVQIEKENRQEFKKLKRERKQERKKRKRNRWWDAK
ncbi:hypothetical protein ABNN70_05835 [Sporolactobacillus sp. Y61]|uniref:Uncharacterized protein n=1 Tax=Sporolactobacillus sp. Y61 TaxID=3160863 RepID=A0AAU8IIB3_9BACL